MSQHCFHRAPSNAFMNQSPPSSQWLRVNERFWQKSHWISKITGMGHLYRAQLANWESLPPREKKRTRWATNRLWQNQIRETIGDNIWRRRSPKFSGPGSLERPKWRSRVDIQRSFKIYDEIRNTLKNPSAIPTQIPSKPRVTYKKQGLHCVSWVHSAPLANHDLSGPNLCDPKTKETIAKHYRSSEREFSRFFPTFQSFFRINKINYFTILFSKGLILNTTHPWWLLYTFIIFDWWAAVDPFHIFIHWIESKI